MASIPTLLVNLAAVKRGIGVDAGMTDDDTLITELAEAVYESMEDKCGRNFLRAERTEYYDGEGADFLLLKNRPVDTGETFSLWDDTSLEWDADDLIDADDYEVKADEGIVVTDGWKFHNGHGQRNMKVTYTGGFTAANVPGLLVRGILAWIAAEYHRVSQGAHGVKSEGQGQEKIVYDSELPVLTKAAITRFRNHERSIA